MVPTAIQPKAIYTSQRNPHQRTQDMLHRTRTESPASPHGKLKACQHAKAIMRNTNQAGAIILPPCRHDYTEAGIQTRSSWYQNRHTGRGNGTENPEGGPCPEGQCLFDTGAKSLKRGTRQSSQHALLRNTYSHMEINEPARPPHAMH